MLRTNTNKRPLDPNNEFAGPELLSPNEVLESFIGFVRRQFPVIIIVTLITAALGIVYLLTTPPSYTGTATMIIDTRKVQLFQQQSILGDIPIDSASVESQLQILKSENVALAVIKKYRLFEDPEFIGGAPSGLLPTLSGMFNNFVSHFIANEPASNSGEKPDPQFMVMRRAMGAFESHLAVKRLGLSYVMEISFSSHHPERAAQIANAVADAYIDDSLEAKYQATRRASVWLQDRIQELREQASAADRAVVEFKTNNNIVAADGKLMSDQQLGELNSQLVTARAQTSEAKARLDRIESILRSDADSATVDATVADALKSEVVTKLRSQYLELNNRQADWATRFGRDHLAVVHLRNQMREIRNSIVDEIRRLSETYKSDYEIAKQREAGVQKELAQAVTESQTTNKAQIVLKELESSSQTYRALYDNFLQRYMESVQQQSFPITEARVISQASRPLSKSQPKASLVMALATLGGMIIGFGISMLRDMSDRVFRTSVQVENLLQSHCITVLPMLQGPAARTVSGALKGAGTRTGMEALKKTLRGAQSGTETVTAARQDAGVTVRTAEARTIVRDQNLIWTVADQPFSRFAEGIRTIKLAADLTGQVRSNKVIGFTSSLPDEGKSLVAGSLAQLIGQTGARVILVDGDLRNPSLTRLLAPRAKLGIMDVIAGKASLEEAVWKAQSTNLSFLPAVVRSRLAHSDEVLASEATKKLFEKLRENYDYVIADFSPLTPIVDVRVTTHLVDSYVFVIEWGRTKIDVVEHALRSAQGIYENLLGVVLNKADIGLLSRYEGHHGSYYYNKHYSRYGYTD